MHHRLSNFSFLNGDSSATQRHNSEFTFKPMGFHYAGIGKIALFGFYSDFPVVKSKFTILYLILSQTFKNFLFNRERYLRKVVNSLTKA
ncbi:hypothetical protein BWD12_18770 [Leptospira santarosai serovar Bananal]|nr:hypothetical protein BWD11_12050 [Leptospira santarosai serovar Grippotyphosa]ONF76357.1 hypothetical protein BWD12_18770 [Leptospira santarosai serovar Bananal]ONF83667.1 hypothetical protein BWD13_17905 [Leptospira santarosai serovar Grippotyphosa]